MTRPYPLYLLYRPIPNNNPLKTRGAVLVKGECHATTRACRHCTMQLYDDTLTWEKINNCTISSQLTSIASSLAVVIYIVI